RRARRPSACHQARGVKLGNPRLNGGTPEAVAAARRARTEKADARAANLADLLASARASGKATLHQIADYLNTLGVPTARGATWSPMAVLRIERRLAKI